MKTYRCYALIEEIEAKDKEEARDKAREILGVRYEARTPVIPETAIVVKRQRTKGE